MDKEQKFDSGQFEFQVFSRFQLEVVNKPVEMGERFELGIKI